jgi:hypothetical protein
MVAVLLSVTIGLIVVEAPASILKEVTTGNWARTIEALAFADTPPAFFTLKYTVFCPLAALSVKEGAVEYGCHAAPEKVEDWLAV